MNTNPDRERTFLIPRKVRTEFTILGMSRRHLVKVGPWWATAILIYYLARSLSPVAHVGIPAVLALIGYGIWGWQGGEDDKTAAELIRRWWLHSSRQSVFLYRKERFACGKPFKPSSRGSQPR